MKKIETATFKHETLTQKHTHRKKKTKIEHKSANDAVRYIKPAPIDRTNGARTYITIIWPKHANDTHFSENPFEYSNSFPPPHKGDAPAPQDKPRIEVMYKV